MEWQERRDALLLATLPHVPFDGWSLKSMREAAQDCGWDASLAERLFPGGPVELVEHFCSYADRLMTEAVQQTDLSALRVPEKVETAIRLRLDRWVDHREAIRRAGALLSLPANTASLARVTWRTADAIWWAIGDHSVDINFYSKRAILSGVYSATALYWLEDRSTDCKDSWDFLRRRLADVGRIGTLRKRFEQGLSAAAHTIRRPFWFAISGRRSPSL